MTSAFSESDLRPATITIEAAARRLGIGRQLAYSLAQKNALPGALKLGRRLVVSTVLLDAFLTDGRPDLLDAGRSQQVEDAAQVPKQA